MIWVGRETSQKDVKVISVGASGGSDQGEAVEVAVSDQNLDTFGRKN